MTEEEKKAYHRAYYQKNKEKSFAQARAWKRANKDKVLEAGKVYHERNKDKIHARKSKYYLDNPDKQRERHAKYREKNKDRIADYHKQRWATMTEGDREQMRINRAAKKDAGMPLRSAEKYREWCEKNKEKRNMQNRERYAKDPERFRNSVRKWQSLNKEKVSSMVNNWRSNNMQAIRDKRNVWVRSSPSIIIAISLRIRIRSAIRSQNTKKESNTTKLLGCTIENARQYIESKFTPGMTWENYGYYGWHIDHIKPCASFDLTDPEQQKACFHYTNLQPLWWNENLSKGAKTDWQPARQNAQP